MSKNNLLQEAASNLRSQERMIYNERATGRAPPIEESEAFELAEKLEELDDFLGQQYDNFADIQDDAPPSVDDYYTGRYHAYGTMLAYIGSGGSQ